MINKLIVSAPLNSLSFGNVSYNILREFYRKNIDIILFPIGNRIDLKAFDRIDKNFAKYLVDSSNGALKRIKKDIPTFKLWHLNGSETKYSNRQYLFTFYELSEPTQEEIAIANAQEAVMFSSYSSMSRFDGHCNSNFIPLGFDEDIKGTDEDKTSDIIHFSLIGKWEKRKHTEKIIKLWLKKFRDNPRYHLNLLVNNPFLKPEIMNSCYARAFDGRKPFNVNIIGHLELNSQVNAFMNKMDIDLSGLSGAEGWGLPAFNMTALGKQSIVLNASAHTDWATKENSLLVNPVGVEPAYDGLFFKQGAAFNQGNIFTWDEAEVSSMMDLAIVKARTVNEEGKKLQKIFSYENTANSILSVIK